MSVTTIPLCGVFSSPTLLQYVVRVLLILNIYLVLMVIVPDILLSGKVIAVSMFVLIPKWSLHYGTLTYIRFEL